MHNIHKKVLMMALFSTALLLSACNNQKSSSSSQIEPPQPEADVIEKIVPNRKAITLFVDADENKEYTKGETKDISLTVYPKKAGKRDIKFVSNNPQVATVDENGLVTAISAGEAIVTVSNADGSVSEDIPVHVANNSVSKRDAKEIAEAIRTQQSATDFVKDDLLLVKEDFVEVLYKDDVPTTGTSFDQYMLLSKSEAYFSVGSTDEEIKVVDGSKELSSGTWVIYTNKSYDTYLFHENGETRTYMVVDTTSYIGQSRLEALYAVLDNLFRSGHDIMVDQYDYALSSNVLNSIDDTTKRGSLKADNMSLNLKQTASYTADFDDENDYYIPYGTPYNLSVEVRCHYDNYYCDQRTIDQSFIYNKDGSSYVDNYKVDYTFFREGIELDYPNRELYQRVDSIFDL